MGAGQRLPRDAAVPGRRHGWSGGVFYRQCRCHRPHTDLSDGQPAQPGELYGEGYTIFDLKLAKNIRFANKRLNIGVDVYNLFNNDAVRTYQDNYDVADNPATAVVEQWGQATGLLSPRFARLSIQFDF